MRQAEASIEGEGGEAGKAVGREARREMKRVHGVRQGERRNLPVPLLNAIQKPSMQAPEPSLWQRHQIPQAAPFAVPEVGWVKGREAKVMEEG